MDDRLLFDLKRSYKKDHTFAYLTGFLKKIVFGQKKNLLFLWLELISTLIRTMT